MAELRDRATGEDYTGTTWNEIAKRLWGTGAYVHITESIGEGCWMGEVREPAQHDGSARILASVRLDLSPGETLDQADSR